MTIEEYLTRSAEAQERTATALEAILAAGTTQGVTAKPAKPAKPATTKVETPPVEPELEVDPLDEVEEQAPAFTEDDVRKALKNYRDINGAEAVTAILTKHGATGMASLKPEHYASVMAAVK